MFFKSGPWCGQPKSCFCWFHCACLMSHATTSGGTPWTFRLRLPMHGPPAWSTFLMASYSQISFFWKYIKSTNRNDLGQCFQIYIYILMCLNITHLERNPVQGTRHKRVSQPIGLASPLTSRYTSWFGTCRNPVTHKLSKFAMVTWPDELKALLLSRPSL